MNEAMTRNDELTASGLKDILSKRFGAANVQYSIRTIARLRSELGWTFTTAKHCEAICDSNKQKRLDWCKKRIEEKELIDNVIFTDESTVQLECHQKMLSKEEYA